MARGGLTVIQHNVISAPSLISTNLPAGKTQAQFPTLERRLGFNYHRVNLDSPSFLASASASGPAAGYSEPLLGEKPEKKKKSIAGIDQDELVDPVHLADPDSCFCEFNGVQIHHKVCAAESPAEIMVQDQTTSQFGLPVILLHGFGASVFSWHQVMKPLAQVIGSKVLAFDRPAFGLTSRANPYQHSPNSEDTKPLNPYSMIFSVLATLFFVDLLAAEKAILVGHSAGSLVAVNTYFEAPERVASLILVAPAIVAPLVTRKVVRDNQIEEDSPNSNAHSNPFMRFFNILSKLSKFVIQAILHLVKGMGEMLNSLYRKALSALLQSAVSVMLIRMVIDKFGIAAIRNSWYDSNQITEHVLHGYTKPLKAKGWDKALVEYTAAMLTDSSSESKPPLGSRLSEISCPVLIVTGDRDRLVPAWNSERLSQAIPGSQLEVIKNCGHLPQEEKAEEFVSVVEKFLHRVFGGSIRHPRFVGSACS